MQLQKAEREINNAQSSRFSEKIGSTLYRVSVYFPAEETETLEAKILRLIKNDLQSQSDCGIIGLLQTSRLPDGGSL
jgi:hypothetical protein